MLVYSVRAIRIRTIPSWIVSEKAKLWEPMIRKIFSRWKKICFCCLLMFFHSLEQLKRVDEKISFWIILFLSQNPVLSNKKLFPLFFETVGSIGLKIFLQVLAANWDAFIFSLWNLVSLKFGKLYKIYMNKKTLFFHKVFSSLLLLICEDDIFQKEK